MLNIIIGIVFVCLGIWGISSEWYTYQYMLASIGSFLLFLLGTVLIMSGLRYPGNGSPVLINNKRDVTIDVLRGFAIFTMIAANMAAFALARPHPFLFRFYGTFAAPIFILISGMMVVYTTMVNGRNFRYFLIRGGLLILIAALIDIFVWTIYPFVSFDVLYLIGVALPIAYLFQRLSPLYRWLIIVAVFLLTPFLQQAFGYTDYPTELTLWGKTTIQAADPTGVINHWLVDGFFPIFPWLGFSLLGVNLAKIRWTSIYKAYSFANKKVLFTGLGTLIIGGIIWWMYPGSLLTRGGYSELFYPPTIGYILCAIGLILMLFCAVDTNPDHPGFKPIRILGEMALCLYILHLIIIKFVIAPIWPENSFQIFLLIYIVFVSALILIAYGLSVLKAGWKDRPFIMRFLLAG